MSRLAFLILVICCVFFPLRITAQLLITKGAEVLTDNDFFYLPKPSDRYYTSGVQIGVYHPELIRHKILGSPFRSLFLFSTRHPRLQQTYAVLLGQYLYTPADIKDQSINLNDQPYAGTLLLRLRKVTANSRRQLEIQQDWYFGIIGPLAGGALTQKVWHQLRKRPAPQGWDSQISNVPAIGVDLQMLKKIWLVANNNVGLEGRTGLSLGTLYNYLEAGPQLRIGRNLRLLGRWSNNMSSKKLRIETSFHIRARWQIQNTLLQGPWWSPSLIPQELSLKPLIALGGVTLLLQTNKLSIDLQQTMITPQFKGAFQHHWGTIHLAWGL
jgi:hypothetical protein